MIFCRPKSRISAASLCLLGVVLATLAFSQDNGDADKNSRASTSSQPSATFSAQVKVVNVLATVRDKKGQILNNLARDDFSLEEDGRPQMIKYFVRDTDLPLKLGLLVDTSRSVSKVLPDERKASESFFDQVLREDKDAAFVIHFDHQVELLQDLTSSRQKLGSATEQIEPSQADADNSSAGGNPGGGGTGYPGGGYPRGGGYPGGRGGRAHGGGGTLLYDAIFLASDELLEKQQGRKAIILLTDGEDRGSKTSLDSAIESEQRADTLIYCIYFKGEEGGAFSPYGQGRGGWGRGGGMGRGGPGRYPQESHEDGKKVLERIAKETGARMFEISKKEPIDKIYTEIQEELRNQYNIGYTPDRNGSTAGYHKIHLVAKQKDSIVQARDGYYE